MATYTATRAASGVPVDGHGFAGNLKVARSSYTMPDATLLTGDIVQMCRVPKGAIVLGGAFYGKTPNTSTPVFDADIGWASNGTDAADSDGFGNLGAWSASAVSSFKPETGLYYPLGGVLFTTGPQTFAGETVIQLEVVASATAWTSAAVVNLAVYYVVP